MSHFHLVTYAQGEPFLSSQAALVSSFMKYADLRSDASMRVFSFDEVKIRSMPFYNHIKNYKTKGGGIIQKYISGLGSPG